ncbi:MAG: MlaD family protein [Plesiomonas sp.]
MQKTNTPLSEPEMATVKTKRRISPFWILPIIAVTIALSLVYYTLREQGEQITIHFSSASGIVPNRTPIRFQGLEVGIVRKVTLATDLKGVTVTADIYSQASDTLHQDTQFWLVTPKASFAGISGLDALVSGNYINMLPGSGAYASTFTALSTPPRYREYNGDLQIHLKTEDLGSLSTGSQVYYRKIPVGSVNDYRIAADNEGVIVDILIEKRFAHLVKANSRFWNTSGVQADISLAGASIKLESLNALINGAIAFDSPASGAEANDDSTYPLYPDLAASQRGLKIALTFPSANGLKAGSTPLMYQGLKVGVLTDLTLDKKGSVAGVMVVDPSIKELLRTDTHIKLEKAAFSLANPAGISSLLTGPTLQLIPGEGSPVNQFTVLDESQILQQTEGALTLSLEAPQSFGVDINQPLWLNGVIIGQVLTRDLLPQGVRFSVVVEPRYRHLIQANSRFAAASRINVQVGFDGVEVKGASAQEWVQGGITLINSTSGSKKSGAAKKSYTLFGDSKSALSGIEYDALKSTLTLRAKELPDIQQGSVVLYRKFPIGQLLSIKPTAQGEFDVAVFIDPAYRYLLTAESVFWAEGGAKVEIGAGGISVQATPLTRALKGAISMDNISKIPFTKGQLRPLYASENAAKAIGRQIILTSDDAAKISANMPIRYLGITVGQVLTTKLANDNSHVEVSAILYPQYDAQFARKGTRFTLVTPEITTSGVYNIDSILSPYISTEPGSGVHSRQFELHPPSIVASRYLDGLPIVLDASDVGSLSVGTPLLYRGVEVGIVTDFSLSQLADRVHIQARVNRDYQKLVRKNTVFWLNSGYNIDFGLFSGVATSGTLNQLLRGGISFATPPTTPLAPVAQRKTHYVLNDKMPADANNWTTAIPLEQE